MRALIRGGIKALAMIVMVATLATVNATPALAHVNDYFSNHRDGWVRCPRPWLVTAYGPVSYCGEVGPNETIRTGFYSPVTNQFTPATGYRPIVNWNPRSFTVQATDGISGTFRGGSTVNSGCCGVVSYGVQYTVYLLQPIGRWGTYNTHTLRFYPESEWFHADKPIEKPL